MIRCRLVQLAHGEGEGRRQKPRLIAAPRIVGVRLDEDPVQLEAANDATIVASEGVGGDESLATAFIAVGEGATAAVERSGGFGEEIETAAVGKTEFLDSPEQRLLSIVPDDRQMKGRGIVVTVEVSHRYQHVLPDAQRIEPGNRLADPELIVRDPAHNFIANRGGRVGSAGGVEIARENYGIAYGLDFREQSPHLTQTAGGGAAVFEMRGDHCYLFSGNRRNCEVHDQGHTSTVANLAIDSLAEEPLHGPALAFFEARRFPGFLSVPVVADGQAHDPRVADGVMAQDRSAMQAQVSDPDLRSDRFADGGSRQDRAAVLLRAESEDRIHFYEFDAKGGIHVERSRQLRGDVAVPGAREEAEAGGWFGGPPYGVAEVVLDEHDLPACSLNAE